MSRWGQIAAAIVRLHKCSPKLTAPQIAAQVGCKLTYVHNVKARRGLRIPLSPGYEGRGA